MIITEIFLFVMSNEISLTLKQNYIWHQFFRKLICIFQKEKSNQLFQTYSSNKPVLIFSYSFLNNYSDKLEATTTFYCTYCSYNRPCEVVLNILISKRNRNAVSQTYKHFEQTYYLLQQQWCLRTYKMNIFMSLHRNSFRIFFNNNL